jgi:5-methylcytosine-specific restriction endonuclease McrA
MSKKEQILQLRQNGKGYNEIAKLVGCSKSLVCYYCAGQREAFRERQRRHRKENVLLKKVDSFKNSPESNKHRLTSKVKDFQSRVGGSNDYEKREKTFSYSDVLEKFGEQTECYLTGAPIDLRQPRTYSFDHIIPKAKGGSNGFENLGIACREANHAKYDMMVEELLVLCERILRHHGYTVSKQEAAAMKSGECNESKTL